MSKFLIDFLGIGAEKSGTTWLADCLKDHPEIYVPEIKEIFFFNTYDPHYLSEVNPKYKRGLKWYARQFKCDSNMIKGELSPTYLYGKDTAQRIKKSFPNIKLIVILRNPTDRAFSQYLHDKRIGLIGNITFEEALERYPNYIEKGKYHKHLTNYYSLFPSENIFVTLLEEVSGNPQESISDIYKFLGVNDVNFVPKHLKTKSNTATRAKFRYLNVLMVQSEYFLKKINMDFLIEFLEYTKIRSLALKIRDMNSVNITNYPKMNTETRLKLSLEFKKDIISLEKLINKKTNWY